MEPLDNQDVSASSSETENGEISVIEPCSNFSAYLTTLQCVQIDWSRKRVGL